MPLYDPKTTALVSIDLQARVMSMNVAPHSAADCAARTAQIAASLKSKGGTVCYVRVAFSEGFADALRQPVDTPMQRAPGAQPADGFELAPALQPIAADINIVKRQWGAFHGTELDLQLRRRKIETIILTGIATNFGVEQTGREAWQHGYTVLFAEDAMSAVSEPMHRFAVDNIFPRLGRTRSTAAIVANA